MNYCVLFVLLFAFGGIVPFAFARLTSFFRLPRFAFFECQVRKFICFRHDSFRLSGGCQVR